jgi:hypothetical protein
MGGVLALRPLLIFAKADMHTALDMIAAYLQAVEEQTSMSFILNSCGK